MVGRKLGFKLSEESKQKMKEIALKRIMNGNRKGLFEIGHKRGMTGKHHNEESKSKIGLSNMKPKSKPYKNKGKKNPYTTIRNLTNNPMNNLETRKKQSIILKNKWEDKKYRERMSKSYNRKLRSINTKKQRTTQVFPIKDTSIEIKIQNYLKQLGIEFYTHQYIKEIEHAYQCDILIPVQEGITKKTIIECDGNYWHNYPYGKDLDIKRRNELRDKGFRVLSFWENEIKVMELNDLSCKLIIK